MMWHKTLERPMPWKSSRDPYRIWLSEIILQQTRLAQGIPYYEKFVESYPTVHDLASANIDEVLKLWQGLGYYNRARSLHTTAQEISRRGGMFPDSYDELLKLKGIGPYTAAAIASFAYGLPHAVVDGNVIRVLSRYLGIEKPVDRPETLKDIKNAAQEFLTEENPGAYNQAIMDFGAVLCTPRNAGCLLCRLQEKCQAFNKNKVYSIPVKAGKIKKSIEYMHYLVITTKDSIVLQKRSVNGIWPGLYEPLLLVHNDKARLKQAEVADYVSEKYSTDLQKVQSVKKYKHILTHKILDITFYHIHLENQGKDIGYSLKEAQQLPHPRVVDKYFKEMLFFKGID